MLLSNLIRHLRLSVKEILRGRGRLAERLFEEGNAFRKANQPREALERYEQALRLKPTYAEALNERARALMDLGRFDEALESCEAALGIRADFAEALYSRGNALSSLKGPQEALASFERALQIKPDYADAHYNRGLMLQRLRRSQDALASYDRALALKPDDAEALNNRGNVLVDLRRPDLALASYERALSLRPGFVDARYNLGLALQDLNRPDEAARCYEAVLDRAPDYPFAKGKLLHAKMLSCEWEGLAALAESVEADIRMGKRSAEPFGYQAASHSEQNLKRCAEMFAAANFPPAPHGLWRGERYDNSRIRVGYVSGEFREQATAILIAGLFERHDKNRFEIYAFDNGWDDGSDVRGRINRAFDTIVDISRLDDAEAALAIQRARIDILVNLNGYFGRERQGVFRYKPAPIQVNYLGFPGTLGAEYMDYILADSQVIPHGHSDSYVEKVVYLPDSYQPNDSERRIARSALTRSEAGLPAQGFVFCCFNNNYKITPAIFDVWMSLLKKVDGSVLWLLEDNAAASKQLRFEAQRRGVAPERIVFAGRLKPDEHLARHALAGLFLDTLPYNAHTTASDALWAGLPLLTCTGTTFPGRVAGSLLRALGLPELITGSLERYEALALELATNPAVLADIRRKLGDNRTVYPLFDTDRIRRHIETAYATMWGRYQRGEPPASFEVSPLP